MSEKPKEIPESLIQAWADFCGIDRSDDRAASPNHPGCWPDNFRLFQAGWNAASVIRDFQIAEKEIPAAMLGAAVLAVHSLGYLNELASEKAAEAALEAAEVPEMLARIAELEAALSRIAKWHGEFPPTGRTWGDNGQGEEMSYFACYGSNGERDYMRQVAADVIKSAGGK